MVRKKGKKVSVPRYPRFNAPKAQRVIAELGLWGPRY